MVNNMTSNNDSLEPTPHYNLKKINVGTIAWKTTIGPIFNVDLDAIDQAIYESGQSGTTNYNDLNNKPQIGGVTLVGNKTAADLSLATTTDLTTRVKKDNNSTTDFSIGYDDGGIYMVI